MSLEELKLRKREVEINSPKSPGYSVRTCVDTEPVPVEMGDERCAESRLRINGTLLGTNGTLRLVFAQGYTNTARWSVTKAINVGVSAQFSVTFKIPEIASLGTDITVKTKVKNEKASAYETTTANTVTQEVWMAAIAGKKCGGYQGFRFVVEGWVWFVYKKKKKGRTRWAVPLDSALTLDERSDWLETKGNMKASVTTDYMGLCE
ncbi:hypothetical protein BD779DRAFT_1557516 [Infundibulicybe gibba]|nr:hypothetical protein BD779DRAFT_1557516 [Infundibulicybe gibba]